MLTQLAIQNAKPREKPYKLSDGFGLHLLVTTTGTKLWRFRYRFARRENMLGFGPFPEVSIIEARDQREAARKLLRQGIDPGAQRKHDRLVQAASADNTFGAVGKEYLEFLRQQGRGATTLAKNEWLLLRVAAPLLKRPITEVTSAELLTLLKRVEKEGKRATARTLRGAIGSVFRYAISHLRATSDPTAALKGSLLKQVVQHRAAITDEQELGRLMRSIETYEGWPTLRAALQFLPLTMTRPGDVRFMTRQEVIFPRSIWRIPAERMKMRRPHDVPLSTQALEVLRQAWSFSEGGELVFPAMRSKRKPLSENAFNSALRRMGYPKEQMTAHGFRSSASTILNERRFDPEVIEAALAHEDEDEVRAAYNRSTYWPQRVTLMQDWADCWTSSKFSRFKTPPAHRRGHFLWKHVALFGNTFPFHGTFWQTAQLLVGLPTTEPSVGGFGRSIRECSLSKECSE
jgi:integrase